MTDGSEKMLSARVPEELHDLINADRRTNQEIVKAALWREFGGERMGALERRVEEKKRRVSMLESEKNERQRELDQEQQELEAIQTKLENVEDQKEQQRQDVADAAADLVAGDAPIDTENPAVKAKAGDIGVEPAELVEEMRNHDDDTGGLSSL